jgi:hypothetical protein
MTIKLVRGDGVWKVVGSGVLAESADLGLAAFDALTLAEIHGTTVELGEGVPANALDLARARHQELEAFRRSRGVKRS